MINIFNNLKNFSFLKFIYCQNLDGVFVHFLCFGMKIEARLLFAMNTR